MMYFNLDPIFAIRGITNIPAFLFKAGFSRHTASNLRQTNYRQPRLDHIERLCKVLFCTPNDILAWRPDAQTTVDKNHPLQQLVPKPAQSTLLDELKILPLAKLEHLQSLIRTELESSGPGPIPSI